MSAKNKTWPDKAFGKNAGLRTAMTGHDESFSLAYHAHQMMHFADHTSRCRRIRQFALASDFVEAEPNKRRALNTVAAQGARDLFHLQGLSSHDRHSQSAAASTSPPSRRRVCNVDTLMLRRAATARGESWCLSALKVARTTLYGFDEPSDFATTSCIPSVSNTARIGPPAMMPVPGGAARRNTLPAP